MERTIDAWFADLDSKDDKRRLEAFTYLFSQSENEVDWLPDRSASLLAKLEDGNSFQRSIGLMLLCNCWKSDREGRLRPHLGKILARSRDEKFITRRQCLQHIWKIAVADRESGKKITAHLVKRFGESAMEKHPGLLRQDIIRSLCAIAAKTHDRSLMKKIDELVKTETDKTNAKKLEAMVREMKDRRHD